MTTNLITRDWVDWNNQGAYGRLAADMIFKNYPNGIPLAEYLMCESVPHEDRMRLLRINKFSRPQITKSYELLQTINKDLNKPKLTQEAFEDMVGSTIYYYKNANSLELQEASRQIFSILYPIISNQK